MYVYSFHPVTKELLGAYTAIKDTLESAKTGAAVYIVPSYATLDTPPASEVGKVIIRVGVTENCPQGKSWTVEEDHRGKTMYRKSDAQPSTVMDIGPIPDTYTELVPCEHPKWNGEAWEIDVESLNLQSIALIRTWVVAQGAAPKELIDIEESAQKQKKMGVTAGVTPKEEQT